MKKILIALAMASAIASPALADALKMVSAANDKVERAISIDVCGSTLPRPKLTKADKKTVAAIMKVLEAELTAAEKIGGGALEVAEDNFCYEMGEK